MNKKHFDVAVIGSGPGGYTAAIRSAQRGNSTALIEEKDLGGVCLNVGCIPTKTLVAGASSFRKIKESRKYGITAEIASFDFSEMTGRKDRIIEDMRQSLETLIKKNQITIFQGRASFVSPKELKVLGKDEGMISADHIIIATGSKPTDIPAFPCDHEKILNSTSALQLKKLPKSVIIIGGGYIGCEFSSLYREMGVDITIIEAMDRILPGLAINAAKELQEYFLKEKIRIHTSTIVKKIDSTKEGVKVHLENQETLEADLAIVAVGRSVLSQSIGLEKAGVATGQRGEILVDDQMRTSVDGIYAIGDVTAKGMLAHVASHQALVAADHLSGFGGEMHYHVIPAVVYTHPEIGIVGLSEEEAKEKGYDVITGRYPYAALGKSITLSETVGFAEIVADKKTGEILGAQSVGYDSANLISEIAVAIKNELTLDCIIDTIHAHPSVAEVWLEAALIAKGLPVNFPPKPKRHS